MLTLAAKASVWDKSEVEMTPAERAYVRSELEYQVHDEQQARIREWKVKAITPNLKEAKAKDELHVGLDIPKQAAIEIYNWVQEQDWPKGTELEPLEQYHITMLFAQGDGAGGHRDDDWIEHESHAVTLKSIKEFPPSEERNGLHPIVLFVESDTIYDHHNKLAEAAEEAGVDPGRYAKDKYQPHMTVAYGPSLPEGLKPPKLTFETAESSVSEPRDDTIDDDDDSRQAGFLGASGRIPNRRLRDGPSLSQSVFKARSCPEQGDQRINRSERIPRHQALIPGIRVSRQVDADPSIGLDGRAWANSSQGQSDWAFESSADRPANRESSVDNLETEHKGSDRTRHSQSRAPSEDSREGSSSHQTRTAGGTLAPRDCEQVANLGTARQSLGPGADHVERPREEKESSVLFNFIGGGEPPQIAPESAEHESKQEPHGWRIAHMRAPYEAELLKFADSWNPKDQWPNALRERNGEPVDAHCTCKDGHKLDCPVHGMHPTLPTYDDTLEFPNPASPVGYDFHTEAPRTWMRAETKMAANAIGWTRGNKGKGLVAPNGEVFTWNVDKDGMPHHGEYMDKYHPYDLDEGHAHFFQIKPRGGLDTEGYDMPANIIRNVLQADSRLKPGEHTDWHFGGGIDWAAIYGPDCERCSGSGYYMGGRCPDCKGTGQAEPDNHTDTGQRIRMTDEPTRKQAADKVRKTEKPHKCKYCKEPATKSLLWAEGIAFIPVCDKHEQKARDHVGEDEVCGVHEIKTAADNFDTREYADSRMMPPTSLAPGATNPHPEKQGCTCEEGHKLDCPVHGLEPTEQGYDHTWSIPEGHPVGYPQDQPRNYMKAEGSSGNESGEQDDADADSGTNENGASQSADDRREANQEQSVRVDVHDPTIANCECLECRKTRGGGWAMTGLPRAEGAVEEEDEHEDNLEGDGITVPAPPEAIKRKQRKQKDRELVEESLR